MATNKTAGFQPIEVTPRRDTTPPLVREYPPQPKPKPKARATTPTPARPATPKSKED